MNIQTPATHNGDPETSFLAEQRMNKSGKRKTHQDIITDFVRQHPKHTAAEIGDETGLGQHECSRRLSELKNITVEHSEKRRCRINGTPMMTWIAKGVSHE